MEIQEEVNEEVQEVQEVQEVNEDIDFDKLFDDYLLGSNVQEVHDLIDKYTLFAFITMVEQKCNDDDKKEKIISKAIEYSFKSVIINQKHPQLDFIYGCRSPLSNRFDWNHALVIVKEKNDKTITMAVFHNGMDYIKHTESYRDAIRYFNKHIQGGWKLMDKEDLEKTSGVSIDANIKINPYWINNTIKNILIGGTIAIVVVRAFKLMSLLRMF